MDNFEDIKSKLNGDAVQQLDRFQSKYTERMKNTMYGLICHAYNQGVKAGRVEAHKEEYEKGYQKGLESNCAAYNLGYGRGQQHLLDALKVIAEKMSPSVLLSYIKNDKPDRIMEQADYYKEEAEREKIRVGDELLNSRSDFYPDPVIVTVIHDDGTFSGITHSGDTYAQGLLSFWRKTGRHFDVEAILERAKNGGCDE